MRSSGFLSGLIKRQLPVKSVGQKQETDLLLCSGADEKRDDKMIPPLCSFTKIAELLPCFPLNAVFSRNSELNICCKQTIFPSLVAWFLPSPPCLSLLSLIRLSSPCPPAASESELLLLFCCFPPAFFFCHCLSCAAALSWTLRAMRVLHRWQDVEASEATLRTRWGAESLQRVSEIRPLNEDK